MIANVICVSLILLGVFACVKSLLSAHLKAKKTGIPSGCCGCAAFKAGECPSHKNCHN